MRKLFFIGLPVLALLVVVAVARTEPNEDRDFNRKLREAWVISDGGYRLGVILSKVKPSQQEKWKIDSGVVVDEVLPDSAAEEAGIQEGDIILRVDGHEVSDASDLRKILKNMEEPKKLTIELLRDGKTLTLIATPEKDDFTFIRGVSRNYLGVELQELDADLAPYFQAQPNAGVLVARVEKGSPADEAGLKSGDVITHLNGKKIKDPDDLRKELNQLKEDEAAELNILRHGAEKKLTAHPQRSSFHMPELREFHGVPGLPMIRDDMEDLKQELERMKKELEKNLKPEIEKLRKELEEMKRST